MNNNEPLLYKKAEIIHCVAYDTQILTDQGYLTIGSVRGQMVNVWNGSRFSPVMIMQSNECAPLLKVTLDNGMWLTCTPNHEWLIQGYDERIKTVDLVDGMQLKAYHLPYMDLPDKQIFSNAAEHGSMAVGAEHYNPARYNCRAREFVPVNYSARTKREWLGGLLSRAHSDDDGVVRVHTDDPCYANQLQLLLLSTGIPASVSADATEVTFKRQGGGSVVELSPRVVSVEALEQAGATYCFEEPENHTGVFNGILTGQ